MYSAGTLKPHLHRYMLAATRPLVSQCNSISVLSLSKFLLCAFVHTDSLEVGLRAEGKGGLRE